MKWQLSIKMADLKVLLMGAQYKLLLIEALLVILI